ncbi:metallophosphoesterase [Pyxidicoccus parkwayensis]|uniref:Metallophosphoesterase n=1 Tax=Pyxidicoccus parkwayensis TaxID=2813578 RepID=A0ABX7P632_9BACT|nr:metallophosphoesterase [Pyxidicoccus parkwaysis]QSQ25890.1 metallophosphoesterase [Pyxidicoccus parkwaysis]
MPTSATQVFFAAVGDVHGHMNRMVNHLRHATDVFHQQFDFVLQVGDFEPHRDEADLATMAAPAKYRHLGDFDAYHRLRRGFPWPVYFIGGNHEPYGYLDTHPEGFELTRHCHYLGRVGVMDLHGLRVVGLSGVYSEEHFTKQRPPLSALGSVSNKDFTYFNERDLEQALELKHADVLLLHDWPSGVITPEDAARFEGQRRSPSYDAVGNDYARLLVDALQPKLVLCGHLHQHYAGTLQHPSGKKTEVRCLSSVEEGWSAFAYYELAGESLYTLGITD